MTISILDVGPMECRYIEGNDHMCCGAGTEGGSWCPEHHAVVFTVAKPWMRYTGRPAYGAAIKRNTIPACMTLANTEPLE